MKKIPLITVWQLDDHFQPTVPECKLVETLEEGVVVIRQSKGTVCLEWSSGSPFVPPTCLEWDESLVQTRSSQAGKRLDKPSRDLTSHDLPSLRLASYALTCWFSQGMIGSDAYGGIRPDGGPGMFIGRTEELARLEREYNRAEGALVPIYGRRRIGKSELILRFMRGRPGLYFLGKSAPATLQIREFLQEAARVLDEPLLAELPPTDWKATLRHVVGRWRGPGRLVLALDEFQWMVEASPELPSVLQELWDREWHKSNRHGARGPRAKESPLRSPYGPDPASPVQLPGGGLVPWELVVTRHRPGVVRVRGCPHVPPLFRPGSLLRAESA